MPDALMFVVDASTNVCSALHEFAFDILRFQFDTAALPLYDVPVSDEPTESELRFEPRFTPEIAAVPHVVAPRALIVVTKLFDEQADAPPYALATPVELVFMSADWMPETVRLVVEAVPKYPSPDALTFVVDASINVCNADQLFA